MAAAEATWYARLRTVYAGESEKAKRDASDWDLPQRLMTAMGFVQSEQLQRG
jgi:hypothetical protein